MAKDAWGVIGSACVVMALCLVDLLTIFHHSSLGVQQTIAVSILVQGDLHSLTPCTY